MAIKIRDSSKALSGKFSTYTKSQYKFLPPVRARAANELLAVAEPKGDKHEHNFEHQPILPDNGDLGYEQYCYPGMANSVVIPHTTMVCSNGVNTMDRVVYIDNTRIAYSPSRELNGTSKRTQTMAKVLNTAKQS